MKKRKKKRKSDSNMQMKATNIDKQIKQINTVHQLKLGYIPKYESIENQIIDARKDMRKIKSSEERQELDVSLEDSSIEKPSNEELHAFSIGDYIAYKDDLDTIGKIISVDKNKYMIRWADNSIERIRFNNLNELQQVNKPLEVNNSIENIPEKQHKESKEQKKKGLTRKSDENIVSNDSPSILKEAKELIQQHKENNDNKQKAENDAKYAAANEIVELGIQKGMIDKDDKDVELMTVSTLSDIEFEDYKQRVLAFNPLDAEVESLTERPVNPDEYAGMSEDEIEAKKMLEHLRGKGVAAFSSQSFQDSYDSSGPRNLKDLGEDSAMDKLIRQQANSDTSNYKTQTQDLEENLYNLLGDKLRETESHQMNEVFDNKPLKHVARRTNDSYLSESFSQEDDVNLDELFSTKKAAKHELKGFENLQGPTKPLVFGQSEPSYKNPMNTSLSEMFANFDWSTTRK